LDTLKCISKWISKKNIEILEEDRAEYEILISLNGKNVYPRIAYCLEQWYLEDSQR